MNAIHIFIFSFEFCYTSVPPRKSMICISYFQSWRSFVAGEVKSLSYCCVGAVLSDFPRVFPVIKHFPEIWNEIKLLQNEWPFYQWLLHALVSFVRTIFKGVGVNDITNSILIIQIYSIWVLWQNFQNICSHNSYIISRTQDNDS